MQLGSLLRVWRQRALLTQDQLAERTGLSSRTIRRLESGAERPRTSSLVLLMDALGLSEQERYVLTGEAGGGSDSATPPAQLPMDIGGFVGRERQLKQLDEIVDSGRVAVIAGPPGVGKTALAVRWGHLARDRFPDGQIYLDLRGFGPKPSVTSAGDALRVFLEGFGVSPQRMPVSLDGLIALYRSMLRHRRVLVVLDNARDDEQVRPLLPASSGCGLAVTSRRQLTGLVSLNGAQPVLLDCLTPGEARMLLANRVGHERVAAEPSAVDAIVSRCAGLPLALAIVAARVATCPSWSMRQVTAELDDATRTLEAFADPDPAADLRAVFSWSYRALSEPAARMFRLLGAHPGPHVSTPAAVSLLGASRTQTMKLLRELARANLVVDDLPGRYALHELVRTYARELLEQDDEAAAAAERLVGHYLHSATAANRRLNPHRDATGAVDHPVDTVPETFSDLQQALAWFTTEHAVLLAVLQQAAAAEDDTRTWELSWALSTYLDHSGAWAEWAMTQELALHAARRLGDDRRAAMSHRFLTRALGWLRRYDAAHHNVTQALSLCGKLNDHIGQARTHMLIAWLLEQQGRHHEALPPAESALRLFSDAGHVSGQADALNLVGWKHALCGNHRAALSYCRRAMSLQRQLGYRYGEANTWDSLGYILHHLGHRSFAADCYRRAIALFRQADDRGFEGLSLAELGTVLSEDGEHELALQAWLAAYDILHELDHPKADEVQALMSGHVKRR